MTTNHPNPSDALLAEIEQRVYDENRHEIAGMAKALVRAGWDAAVSAGVVAEEPEWGVWDRRDCVFRHVEPPTEENARREAALGGSEFEATRVLPWVPAKQEDQTTKHEIRRQER